MIYSYPIYLILSDRRFTRFNHIAFDFLVLYLNTEHYAFAPFYYIFPFFLDWYFFIMVYICYELSSTSERYLPKPL